MNEPLLISRQELIRNFGFSARLVEDLGPPDFIRANREQGFTYLYDLARVETFLEEHAERIERILAARPRRQASARAVWRQRREEMVQWSRSIPLVLEPLPPHALEHARRYFAPQSLTKQRALLYLRLHYTNYLECVRLAALRQRATEVRQILCERVNTLLIAALEAQGITLPK